MKKKQDPLEKSTFNPFVPAGKKRFEGEDEDIPIVLARKEGNELKRHSILIPMYDVIEQIARKNKWSINETVTYAISLFLFLIDTDPKNPNTVFESAPLRSIRDQAARHDLEDGEILRNAADMYARFLKEGLIQKGLTENEAIKKGERSIQGLFADILKENIHKIAGKKK